MSIRKPLGKRLSTIRKMRGLTQSGLATRAGVDYRHYQDIEAGKVNTSFKTLDNLAQALTIKTCYLLDVHNNKLLEQFNILCPMDLLSKLDLGITILDKEGTIHFQNLMQKKIMELDFTEKKEKLKIWDLVHNHDDHQYLKKHFSYIMEEQRDLTPFSTNYKDINGAILPMTLKWNYLLGKKKEILGAICLIIN